MALAERTGKVDGKALTERGQRRLDLIQARGVIEIEIEIEIEQHLGSVPAESASQFRLPQRRQGDARRYG